jgi:hypothetical protein
VIAAKKTTKHRIPYVRFMRLRVRRRTSHGEKIALIEAGPCGSAGQDCVLLDART